MLEMLQKSQQETLSQTITQSAEMRMKLVRTQGVFISELLQVLHQNCEISSCLKTS